MDLGQAANRAQHPAGADVDLEHLAGAKMRHEQQTAAGIKTRVIQPGVAARQGIRATTRKPGAPEANEEAECAGRLT